MTAPTPTPSPSPHFTPSTREWRWLVPGLAAVALLANLPIKADPVVVARIWGQWIREIGRVAVADLCGVDTPPLHLHLHPAGGVDWTAANSPSIAVAIWAGGHIVAALVGATCMSAARSRSTVRLALYALLALFVVTALTTVEYGSLLLLASVFLLLVFGAVELAMGTSAQRCALMAGAYLTCQPLMDLRDILSAPLGEVAGEGTQGVLRVLCGAVVATVCLGLGVVAFRFVTAPAEWTSRDASRA